MKEVKYLKLVTGDEFICQCELNGETYTVEKPVVLFPNEEGNLVFAPFLPATKMYLQKTIIKSSNVLFCVDLQDSLKNSYNNSTGAIVVPDKGLKLSL